MDEAINVEMEDPAPPEGHGPASGLQPSLDPGAVLADHSRSYAFLLARATLIIATAYMVLAQTGFTAVPATAGALILLGLASCAAAFRVPKAWLESPAVTAGVLIADTAWITGLLLSVGSFETEFFYLYFFVLFLAAIGERLGLIALGAVVVCAAYLYVMARAGRSGALAFDSSTLIRVPFLFTVAIFYGYLVDRVRRERHRASVEAASVRRLEEVRTNLEAANRKLETEARERRRAEDQVRKLSQAVEQSPTIVIITDTQCVVEYVNPRFVATTGSSAEEVIGRSLRGLPGFEAVCDVTELGDVLAEHQEWRGELRYKNADEESIWVSTSISPLRNEQGEQTHFIVVQEEITERKQAELSLREAHDELARLSELKSSFVSIVSHELRTPLTSIKNAVDLVRSGRTGKLEPDQVRFLEIATRNLDRLALITNDLLDLSKIEAGRIEYRFSAVSASGLLDDVHASYKPQAAETGVELVLERGDSLAPVWADPNRLSQVLDNLVGNALKFTGDGGRITLEARRCEGSMLLEVTDTGAGIDPGDLERIFEPFHQAEDCLTRSCRGTGLGLSVARELVWAHGGDLAVASRPGQGSRFTVRLPAAQDEAKELVEMEEALRRQRIYPASGLLCVRWPLPERPAWLGTDECWRSVLFAVRDVLAESLLKETDVILVQPKHHRLVLVLPNTPRVGTETVRGRLERCLGNREIRVDGALLPTPQVFGPEIFPEDGATARALLAAMEKPETARGAQTPAEPGPRDRFFTRGELEDDRPHIEEDPSGGRRAGRHRDGEIPTDAGGLRRRNGEERDRGFGYGALLSA